MRYLLAIILLFATSFVRAAVPLVATVGDSIVQTYPPGSTTLPTHGWSQEFPKYFTGVTFQNFAISGQSTKTFLNQGHWATALAAAPKFVLIEFGHNDANSADPNKYTDPNTTYQTNLTKMIADARAIGARPILVTPAAIRVFGTDGKVTRTTALTPYVTAMKTVGARLGVGVIDLHTATLDLYDSLGAKKSQSLLGYNVSSGAPDTNHFNAYGADQLRG